MEFTFEIIGITTIAVLALFGLMVAIGAIFELANKK